VTRFSPNQWFELPLSISEDLKEELLNWDIENAKNYFIHEPEENHRLEFLEIPLTRVKEVADKFMITPTRATLVAIEPNSGIPFHTDGQTHDYWRPTIACFPLFPNSKTYECTEYRDGFVPYCDSYIFNTQEEHRAAAGDCRRINLQLWFDQLFGEVKTLFDSGKLLI
tara:strand:+ start:3589 stop:4092 length:504 start_codon:yes stop_codon:yes gene_type:complete